MTSESLDDDAVDPGLIPWDDESDDEEPVSQDAVTTAVVTDTDWTTETMLSQLRRGNIHLNPRFQRRDAWDVTRKSRFIESLILGLPIPQLVLAEDKKRRGAFIVLDGKQRLLTLRQFAEGSSLGSRSAPKEFDELRLANLEVRPDLNGYNLARLEGEPVNIDDLNAILNQTVRTVVVRRWPNEEFLNLVFLRLNTGSVQLSPQELRQALHPGNFTDFLDDTAAKSEPVKRALRIRKPDFRMRDVEILLRYYAIRTRLAEYRGNLKVFLDSTVELFNQKWESDRSEIESIAREFDESIEATFNVFGRNAFFRWDTKTQRYERRFNRALFDSIMYHFVDPTVREAAIQHSDQVEADFKRLCERNADFVRSIQTSTKTVGATFLRIRTWGTVLSKALNLNLHTPKPASG